jgi:hypothetical protein
VVLSVSRYVDTVESPATYTLTGDNSPPTELSSDVEPSLAEGGAVSVFVEVSVSPTSELTTAPVTSSLFAKNVGSTSVDVAELGLPLMEVEFVWDTSVFVGLLVPPGATGVTVDEGATEVPVVLGLTAGLDVVVAVEFTGGP